MNWKIAVAAALAVIAVLVVVDGVFIVRPYEFAIVTEFGDPVSTVGECIAPVEFKGQDINDIPLDEEGNSRCTEAIPAPGLHFKIPLTQSVARLDSRVRGWDDRANDTKTVELRTIDFEAFARWRISDPLKFYTATRSKGTTMAQMEKRAQGGMDSIVTARIQAAVREHKLVSIVRDRGRAFEARAELNLKELIADYDECRPEDNSAIAGVLADAQLAAIKLEQGKSADDRALRSEIVNEIRDLASAKLQKEFGIRIFDLHFKYLNYSIQVHQKMIESIRADRERDIASYRKVGKVCVGSIDQVKVRRKGEIIGARDKAVRKLGGEAQAVAIRTKAAAFNRDPNFFRFLRTLELYEGSLGDGTKLVLSSDSPLFSLMNDAALLADVKKRDLPVPNFDKAPEPTPANDNKPAPEEKPAPAPAPATP